MSLISALFELAVYLQIYSFGWYCGFCIKCISYW